MDTTRSLVQTQTFSHLVVVVLKDTVPLVDAVEARAEGVVREVNPQGNLMVLATLAGRGRGQGVV